MKILFAADGSPFTKKALAFLVPHEGLCSADNEIVVINVQPRVPPRVTTMLGAAAVRDYHRDEARKVLDPIERFLKRHASPFRTKWVVGSAAPEVLKIAAHEKVHMIVMGTHGHGVMGRALMGSVAQRVVTDGDLPVLLVK